MNPETNLPIPRINLSLLKARFVTGLIFLLPVIVLLLTYTRPDGFNSDNIEISNVEINNPFSDISLMAKSVYVWDIEKQRELYAKDEKIPLPLASLTKITAALVALDKMTDMEKIKITSDSIRQEGDNGLINAEEWKLKNLIDFSLVSSSNDGMYAVASAVESIKSDNIYLASLSEQSDEKENNYNREYFIYLMNKKAKDIELNQTFYLNETGLDMSDGENGGYGSAEDMAKLFAYVVKNKSEMLEATTYDEVKIESIDGTNHIAKNTNDIVGEIPGLIGSKTGYTDISGGNLVVSFDSGLMRPIVISVLGSTRDGRFDDMKKLVQASMKYLESERF